MDPEADWPEEPVPHPGEVVDEDRNPPGPYRLSLNMTHVTADAEVTFDEDAGSWRIYRYYYRCYEVSGGHGNYSYRLTTDSWSSDIRYVRIVPESELWTFDRDMPGNWLTYPRGGGSLASGEDHVCVVAEKLIDLTTGYSPALTLSLYAHDFESPDPQSYSHDASMVRMTFTFPEVRLIPLE